MATPLTDYLNDLRATRATGANTAETSFYPAIKALLDAVGARLKPKVRCIMNLRDQGAGLPDGGLFSADQFSRGMPDAPGEEGSVLTRPPSRGAIEVKPPSWSMSTLAMSAQVTRYGNRYRHVLLTNLREFWLVEHCGTGAWSLIESYQLAESETALWQATAHPAVTAERHEERFLEFLERVLLTPAPLYAPADVAWFLASYARDALSKIKNAPVGGLTDVAEALEQALGVGFRGEKGLHFFHSTLVQTLFYGTFSAWVLWCRQPSRGTRQFSWRDTGDLLHLPMLRVLFHEMTRPTSFFTHNLRQALDLAEATLNRVSVEEFFARFEEHEAVQYFYEPFLEAFDPALRRELGVWYTPREVVDYMVERVDRAVRNDLGIVDGLADPRVLVLDPCCGTGAFVVAVLERIVKTLREQGEDATLAAQVAEAAVQRIIGFEILPAPFVVAHLQVGLFLQSLGVGLTSDQRAAVYLTNALTGWERPEGRQARLIPELAAERDAADGVKRKARVLVVLGNPPYNAFAGVQPVEEQVSVDVYKEGLYSDWKIRKYNLDDLYVRFIRLAERKIVEQTHRGVVCLISNASYVNDPSFVVLRERLLTNFNSITIDNLNGDSRETGKLTPDGRPDPSVFSTPRNREGIRVGTAVGTFVLARASDAHATVKWRDFWGANKREQLLASLQAANYDTVAPKKSNRWSFRPHHVSDDYALWMAVPDLAGRPPISGLAEKRRGGLLGMEREVIEQRMAVYFDGSREWNEIEPLIGGLAIDAGRYPAKQTRERQIRSGESFDPDSIKRYALLPLDNRWCYHSTARPLWNEPRPDLSAQAWTGNRFLILRPAARRADEGLCSIATTALPDHHLLDPNVLAVPFRWREGIVGRWIYFANLSTQAPHSSG